MPSPPQPDAFFARSHRPSSGLPSVPAEAVATSCDRLASRVKRLAAEGCAVRVVRISFRAMSYDRLVGGFCPVCGETGTFSAQLVRQEMARR
jgi:hypothetical protein